MYVEIADTFEADHNYASLIFSDDFYTAIWTGSTGSSVPGYNFLVIDTLTDVVNSFPGLTAPTLTNAVTEDATTTDFSLLATSSCINKGINTGVLAGSIDYAGNSRIYGSAIDIGAYEWKPALTAINSALPAARINAYPNPATDLIIISTPKPNGILQITDMSGRVVVEKTVINLLTSFEMRFIPLGVYFAIWNDGNNDKETLKIILE